MKLWINVYENLEEKVIYRGVDEMTKPIRDIMKSMGLYEIAVNNLNKAVVGMDAKGNKLVKTFEFMDGGVKRHMTFVRELGGAYELASNKIIASMKNAEVAQIQAERTARRLAESQARQARVATLQQIQAQRAGFPVAELTPALESRAWEENARRTAAAQRAAERELARQRALGLQQMQGAFISPGGTNYGARPLTGAAYNTAYLQNAMIDAGKLDKNLQSINKTSQNIVLNFRNLARIFQYQLAYQALSSFTNALVEGAAAARDFYKEIALIQTISQEAQLPVERWAEGIKKISNTFGTSLQDTAKATYEAISNQVAKGEDALKFMESVGKLAATTGSTQMEAMEALSAVINSYGISINEADAVSAKFFKVVDLGRIHLRDFATSIGTALAPAAQLGVTFDEVGAMLAQLSIKGISPQQSITEIRQLMVALIKPSKEMNKALKDLGYESAQSAIQAMGFARFLEALIERADNSSEEMGRLFINIRALIPALALAADGTAKFDHTIQQLQNSAGEFGNAFGLVMNNAGKQTEIFQTRVRNWFATLGGQIIEGVGYWMGIVNTIGDKAQRYLDIKMTYVNMEMETIRKNMKEAQEREVKAVRLQSAEIFKIYQTRMNKLVEILKTGHEDMERINEQLISKEKEHISELNSIQKKATQNIERLQNWLEERQRKNTSFFFDLDIENAKPLDKIKMIFAEIAKLQQTSAREIGKGNYDQFFKNQDDIIESYKQIDKIRQDNAKNLASDITKRNELEQDYKDKFIKLQADIFQAQQKPGSGHRLSDLQKQMQILNRDYVKEVAELNKKIQEETQLYQTQYDLKKKINEQMAITKKLTEEAIANEKRMREEAEKEETKRKVMLAVFTDMVKEFNKFDITKVLGLGSVAEINKAMDTRQQAYERIMNAQKAIGIDIKDSELFATNRMDERKAVADRIAQLEQEARNRALDEKYKAAEIERKAAESAMLRQKTVVAQMQTQLNTFLQQSQGIINNLDKWHGGAEGPLIDELKAIQSLVIQANKPSIALDELQLLQARIAGAAGSLAEKAIAENKGVYPSQQAMHVADLSGQLYGLFGVIDKLYFAKKDLTTYEELYKIQTSAPKIINAQTTAQKEATKAVVEAIPPLERWKQSVKALTQEAQNQLDALQQIRPIPTMEEVMKSPAGLPLPMIQLAHGGVGRDTIPAMLSPGEFVMNPRATRKFYGQLVAMNGNVPAFANGGPVNTFGDFNITVQASGKTPVDIVNIGKGLRRAIRQGRVTL